MDIPQELIRILKSSPHIKIIGISGFGGAGKSTASKILGKELNAETVGIDSFQKSHDYSEYSYWENMGYNRMKQEVILPLLEKQEKMLIVEGVGLFRPDMI